jgi:hypothetical protein
MSNEYTDGVVGHKFIEIGECRYTISKQASEASFCCCHDLQQWGCEEENLLCGDGQFSDHR